MQNDLFKISSAICHSVKNFSQDSDEALLSMQVMLLALYNATSNGTIVKAEFNLDDISKLGLDIQYTEQQLEELINSGRFKDTLEIEIGDEMISLVKCAICQGTAVTVYFKDSLNSLILPTEKYSLFRLSELVCHHSAGGIALHMFLIAEQNENYVHSGDAHTYVFDFTKLCDILGLKYPTDVRPGRRLLDSLICKSLSDIRMTNKNFTLSFSSIKTGSSHRLTGIELYMSGLHCEGIYGLNQTELIADGEPWFSSNLGHIMGELISHNNTISFSLDSLGRCTAATSLLTREQVESYIHKGGTKLLPLGYDRVKATKGLDDRYALQKAHLIARRFSGPDTIANLIAGSVSLNKDMAKIENAIAKYLLSEDGAIVLYRVEPIYEDDCLIPCRVRLGAINLGPLDTPLKLSYEILNGVHIDYESKCEEAV